MSADTDRAALLTGLAACLGMWRRLGPPAFPEARLAVNLRARFAGHALTAAEARAVVRRSRPWPGAR